MSKSSKALVSTPALAAALRRMPAQPLYALPTAELLRRFPLVQMYQIRGDLERNEEPEQNQLKSLSFTDACTLLENRSDWQRDREEEIQAAVHVLGNVADRLRRLSIAYAEWDEFDGCAYFDLTRMQAGRLLRVVERVTTVHVTFFADLLLPSFQAAECTLLRHFAPEYRLLRSHLFDGLPNGARQVAAMPAGYDEEQTQMITQWQCLVEVVRGVRAILHDDIRFWATNGAEDERARWRHVWMKPSAPGLDLRLTPPLADVPSLTLSIDFPLPSGRQPGRLRRLRRLRNRFRRQPSGNLDS